MNKDKKLKRTKRAPLPPRTPGDDVSEFSHEDLLNELHLIEELVDVGHNNFHFKGKPFLHFHQNEEGIYADVKLGGHDFEPIWAESSHEKRSLLGKVYDYVEANTRSSKPLQIRKKSK